VAYNRRALKVYTTEARLRPTTRNRLKIKYYIIKQCRQHANCITGTMNSVGLRKGKSILKGDGIVTRMKTGTAYPEKTSEGRE
jgi:hypothetical protein